MAGKSNRPPSDTFKFTKEMGARLAELRRRAGLTQAQVAANMARKGKGSAYLVGRLEAAKSDSPSLRLIADYLRACRAKFSDIADLLDAYTTQPMTVVRIIRTFIQGPL